MAIANAVWTVLEEQEALVLKIDIPEINEYAKKIAFYYAMYNAALDDPMELSADQDEMLDYFQDKLDYYGDRYQELVNKYL